MLAERKDYSISVARNRITLCGLSNVEIFCDDIVNFEASNVGLGIGLHCCGLLTDLVLRFCVKVRAGFVITPCCYGQIASPPPALKPGAKSLSEDLAPEIHRSVSLLQQIPRALPPIAAAADYCSNFDDDLAGKGKSTSASSSAGNVLDDFVLVY